MSQLLYDWLSTMDIPKKYVDMIHEGYMYYDRYWKKLEKKKNVKRTDITYAFLQNLDKVFKEEDNPSKAMISCRKGCSFCCNINVDITEGEAELIELYCKKNKITIDYAKAREDLHKEIAPCIFLKDGSCSVYDVRPSVCRKYFVVSDPILCDAEKFKRGRVVNYLSIPMEIINLAIGNNTGASLPMREMFVNRQPGSAPRKQDNP